MLTYKVVQHSNFNRIATGIILIVYKTENTYDILHYYLDRSRFTSLHQQIKLAALLKIDLVDETSVQKLSI